MKLTHPNRVYWKDGGITKQQLADYYTAVWDHIAPHVVNRPLALVRCPEGIEGQCFFQKHAAAGLISDRIKRHKDRQGEELIYIEDLEGLLTLVQAGVLEIHVWGSTIDDVEHANRIVFDLDPGDDVKWADVNKAARDLRERLAAVKLKSFVKTTGGKGLHVVVPTNGTPWDETKDFAHAMVLAMAADEPDRYVVENDQEHPQGKDLPRLSAQRARRDRHRRLFDARASGRGGVGAGRLGRAWPEARAEQVHPAQHRAPPRRAEEGSVGRHRQGEAEPAEADVKEPGGRHPDDNRPSIGRRATLT